jgi:acyl-CoA dehydrogenase
VDFRLSPEVAAAQARMRRFVERELVPRESTLPAFANTLPAAEQEVLVGRLRSDGLWGLAVPREFGGGGMGLLGLCALREALGHTTLWSLARLLGTEPPVLLYGCNPEQRERFLMPTLRGERAGCFSLTEPDAGSDAAAIQTVAVPDGPTHYRLNGRKIFTSHADEADYALVFARTPGAGDDRGITLFLVDIDTPGMEIVRQIDTMGGDRPSEVRLTECRVPAANILGAPGQAFELAQQWFACDRIALQPPITIGAAGRCLRLAQEAGVAPARELGELALRVTAARQMLYHAAWAADAGRPAQHLAAMVKATTTTTGLEVVDRVLQWFGPAGYGRDLPFERYYRDLRRFTIAAGTFEIQQFVIARGLLRGYAALDAI